MHQSDPEGAVPTLGLVFPAPGGDGGRGIRAAIAPWASFHRFVELLSPMRWTVSSLPLSLPDALPTTAMINLVLLPLLLLLSLPLRLPH